VVCEDGRAALLKDPTCARFPWSQNDLSSLLNEDEPPAISDLGIEGASLSGLMDKKAILLFTDQRCVHKSVCVCMCACIYWEEEEDERCVHVCLFGGNM